MSGGQLPTNHLHDINWARPLDHVSRAPQLMFIWKVTKSVYTHTHTHTHNSYMTFIGVHEMHGRVHSNLCHVTDLLVVDLCSSLAYSMMTQISNKK